jgi:hypothetical protein
LPRSRSVSGKCGRLRSRRSSQSSAGAGCRENFVSVDEYLRKHVESVSVPGAEVDRAYEASRDQFPGVLPAEAKYRVRRTLEVTRAQRPFAVCSTDCARGRRLQTL